MGKSKSEENVSAADESSAKDEGLSYEEKLENVSIIAKPMAPKKLTKKIHKLIKKASKQKTFLRNGLKDVQTRIRKGETGLVIFAGDVTPIEVMCHLPGVCEDKSIPYCYTPCRADLGQAMGVKRGSLMVLIRDHPDYKELYDECISEVKNLPQPF
ncbi:H/ACA ribonucleoprotein complex subunit 2-like protein [Chrysoperla carnea]|uniref:H/ACA ribonucleoprotein complex subunit 2-like protein n=1 Tax=Chrysoperla carnea TaxID=189513 RepID=UPI001D088FAE|nr:H/ACA ribonucleoprotein complex subunit 2-like protein [Chrysoperla carnea]